MTGTFLMPFPAEGRSWHVAQREIAPDGSVIDTDEALCAATFVGSVEVWTTSTMPEWKVCADCIAEAAR